MAKNEARKVDQPTYTIDPKTITRFDQRHTVFNRERPDHGGGDRAWEQREKTDNALKQDIIEKALSSGAWQVDHILHDAFLGQAAEEDRDAPIELRDPAENSRLAKAAAAKLGAARTGICKANPLWIYSHDRAGEKLDIVKDHPHAIVMLIAMNPDEIRKAPTPAASAEVRIAYLHMSVYASAMAGFLRALGFRAVPCGNGTALSVPLAIDAGLGEAGRNGQLITPEFGSFVRICKVFTDMPLEFDKPIDMGLQAFCAKCGKCARQCPVQAIGSEKEPEISAGGPHSRPGIKRWSMDPVKCHDFWHANGTSCSVCMAVCPFTAES